MGFLDDLKERFGFGGAGDDYYDDYYDDEVGQDDYEEEPRRASRRSRERDYDRDRDYQPSSVPRVQHDYEGEPQGLLGNTSRPTAESVSVYTRSGHLVDSNSGLRDAAAPAPYSRNAAVTGDSAWTDSRLDYTPSASAGYGQNPQSTGAMRPIPQAAAPGFNKPLTNLPPYVLRPEAYDDCTTIMKRVRTSQPVVLAFAETDMEIAKRILDFCFGFACGINGRVEELGDKTFAILPEGVELSKAAFDKLVRDGVLEGSVE